jgi:hypothetical protein
MDDPDVIERQTGLLSRLTRDPVRLRRRARWASLGLGLVAALAGAELVGGASTLLYGLCWLMAMPLALAIGYGDAFFLGYGRGLRRVLLTLVGSVVGSIASCVVLSTTLESPETVLGRVLAGALYAGLLLCVLYTLAALLALGLSRGLDYAGRQIAQLDDEGW